MTSIDRRNRFALCALVSALSIAAAAAGKTPDSSQTSPTAAQVASPASPASASTPPAAPEDPAPPAPPATPPRAPSADAAAPQPAAASASGQWVYTSQYGWVWLPYDARYTSVSTDGDAAYMYVYDPAGGWRWVSAPWVLGWGPRPLWGAFGPVHFAWYAHPWFRVGFAHLAPWHAHFGHRR